MKPGLRKILEDIICLLILAVVAIIAFYPIVLNGKVPVAAESTLFEAPWEEARPPGLNAPHNPYGSVQANSYYPAYRFISDATEKGDSLLWNAYENCGMPFLAQWRTRCLSPFSIPFYYMKTPSAIQFSVLLKLIIAGWCAFYAARRLGFRPPLALMVGITFELSSHIYLWSGWPISDVVPWLPLLILFAERTALGQSHQWPSGAIVVALMLLGGDPESVFGAVLFVSLFLVLRLFMIRRDSPPTSKQIMALPLAVVFGITLAAVQILPFIELLFESVQTRPIQMHGFTKFTDLAVWFLPHFPEEGPALVERAAYSTTTHTIGIIHMGIAQVLCLWIWLSVRSFTSDQQRKRIESILGAAFIMACISLLLQNVVSNTAIAHFINVRNFFIGMPFALALCSASAILEWTILNPRQCEKAVKRILIFLPIFVVLLTLTILVPLKFSSIQSAGIGFQIAISCIFAIAFLGIVVLTLFKPSESLAGYALALLALINLTFAFFPGITFMSQDQVFPDTSFVSALKDLDGRVAGSVALKKWPLAGNQVQQLYGTSGPKLNRYPEFIKRIDEDPYLISRTGASTLLLTKEDIQGPYADMRHALKVREVFTSGAILFEGLEMNPRAWMIYHGQAVDKFDPALINNGTPHLIEGLAVPDSTPGSDATVSITDARIDGRTSIHVNTSEPGILVLADSWYPGWHSTVDGNEVKIGKVDGIFRGIDLDKGEHNIEFYYDPMVYKIGLGITIASVLIVSGGFCSSVVRRFKKSKKSEF